mmetsp:Transcript_53759/g.156755  ORF Transcript_53759/g.156755 Transcript_53759/m.156755 type:complete len:284 (+) Transcript_53759:259-1110(+)
MRMAVVAEVGRLEDRQAAQGRHGPRDAPQLARLEAPDRGDLAVHGHGGPQHLPGVLDFGRAGILAAPELQLAPELRLPVLVEEEQDVHPALKAVGEAVEVHVDAEEAVPLGDVHPAAVPGGVRDDVLDPRELLQELGEGLRLQEGHQEPSRRPHERHVRQHQLHAHALADVRPGAGACNLQPVAEAQATGLPRHGSHHVGGEESIEDFKAKVGQAPRRALPPPVRCLPPSSRELHSKLQVPTAKEALEDLGVVGDTPCWGGVLVKAHRWPAHILVNVKRRVQV